MKLLEPGAQLDGFTIDECIHSGGMAHIYRVHYTQRDTDGAGDPGFPMAMKIPRMTAGDGAENIVSFEVEHQILQVLSGPHVPRFVAACDLENVPYLVMEYVTGQTLQHWLDAPERPAADELARLGAAMALAVHSLHQQNTVHLDLKPANVACVTVISPGQTSAASDEASETRVHRKYLASLRQWAQPLDLAGHQASYHVLEAGDVAQALVSYAVGNQVSLIVMGAATHGLKTQRFLATVPVKVAMEAPCTVILVKQALPFEQLVNEAAKLKPAWNPDLDAPF